MHSHRTRSSWGAALLLSWLCLVPGCAPRGAAPEEFPPVHLGMSRSAVLEALAATPARLLEETPQVVRAAGRDPRVVEEVFLFYDGDLAAWTQRLAEPASRESFAREHARFTRYFGEPLEGTDNGLVLTSRWRMAEEKGRVLLSAYTGDRSGNAPLMVRAEDPSVVGSLIRQMSREEAQRPPAPAPDSTGHGTER